MKNTTKKILSMLLAVIMLLSVMPFRFPVEAKLSIEGQEHIDAYIKLGSYSRNLYKHGSYIGGIPEFIYITIENAVSEVETRYPDYNLESHEYMNDSANAEAISEGTKIYKAAAKEIETFFENHKITVVIDTYECWKYMAKLDLYYSNEELNSFIKNNKNAGKIDEAVDILRKAYEEIYPYSGKINTQEEFDACWKKACPVLDSLFTCLDGNHPYGEYISNNDATEEADGTKTATCEFCGATDTVIDEGSKLESDNDTCSCNCHKSGIMAFIWKILNFFYKIFGMNKTCVCGVAHY